MVLVPLEGGGTGVVRNQRNRIVVRDVRGIRIVVRADASCRIQAQEDTSGSHVYRPAWAQPPDAAGRGAFPSVADGRSSNYSVNDLRYGCGGDDNDHV